MVVTAYLLRCPSLQNQRSPLESIRRGRLGRRRILFPRYPIPGIKIINTSDYLLLLVGGRISCDKHVPSPSPPAALPSIIFTLTSSRTFIHSVEAFSTSRRLKGRNLIAEGGHIIGQKDGGDERCEVMGRERSVVSGRRSLPTDDLIVDESSRRGVDRCSAAATSAQKQ